MNRNLEFEQRGASRTGSAISSNLMYLLIGGGIGATVALLFAPKSGTELRQDIGDVTRRGYDETLELAGRIKDQSNQLYSSIRDKADQVYGFASEKLHLQGGETAGEVARKALNEGKDAAEGALANGGLDAGKDRQSASSPRQGNIH